MAFGERFTLRSLYLYMVCLITLIVSLFAAVSVVRNVVELAYPDPGYCGYGYAPADKEPDVRQEDQRAAEQRCTDSQRRSAVLGLVGSGTTLIIAAPLYLYHWRRVQAEQTGATTGQPEPDSGS